MPKSKWVWAGNATITQYRSTHSIVRKRQRSMTGNYIQKTIKVKQSALNQLSLLQCHYYKTRKDTIFCKTKEGPYTKHPQALDSASTNSHQIGIQPRLRESSQQASTWENTIRPSLSVIPGHSTSSGQCSPSGRKDNKVCKQPRSWWAAHDNWNITRSDWQPSKKGALMTTLSVRHMQTREQHYLYVLGHKSFKHWTEPWLHNTFRIKAW